MGRLRIASCDHVRIDHVSNKPAEYRKFRNAGADYQTSQHQHQCEARAALLGKRGDNTVIGSGVIGRDDILIDITEGPFTLNGKIGLDALTHRNPFVGRVLHPGWTIDTRGRISFTWKLSYKLCHAYSSVPNRRKIGCLLLQKLLYYSHDHKITMADRIPGLSHGDLHLPECGMMRASE
ncbi:hypothetical protein Bbelb_403910 [Branchiostoma belcheri]|nr:hypothetical protein Bbelb_403910 [Branchiostoma belcheri]